MGENSSSRSKLQIVEAPSLILTRVAGEESSPGRVEGDGGLNGAKRLNVLNGFNAKFLSPPAVERDEISNKMPRR